MSIGLSKNGNVLVVTTPPRLDTATAPEAETALAAAVAAGDHRVVIDFSKTLYISSAGLRVLVKLSRLVAPKGGAVALCNANPQVREVLEMSGFLAMLTYCGSLKDALGKVGG